MSCAQTSEVTKTHRRTARLPLYKVIFHNDDTTVFEFVVMLLIEVFSMTEQEAEAVTKEIHVTGLGIAGVFDKETAEAKTEESRKLALMNGFKLAVTYEAE